MAEQPKTWTYVFRDTTSILSAFIAISVVFSWIGNFWIRNNEIKSQQTEIAALHIEVDEIKQQLAKSNISAAVIEERIFSCCSRRGTR